MNLKLKSLHFSILISLMQIAYFLKLKSIFFLQINIFIFFIATFLTNHIILSLLIKIPKVGLYIATFLFAIPNAVYFLSLFLFGYKMDRSILASALENDSSMIFYYVTPSTVSISIFFTLLIFFLIKSIKEKSSWKNIGIVFSIFFTINLFFIAKNCIKSYQIKKNTKEFLNIVRINPVIDFWDLLKIKETKIDSNYEKPDNKFSFQTDDINIVIIVGESLRADFFEKYATKIQKEKIHYIGKSHSFTWFTRNEVPRILSLKTNNQKYSITDIMNSLNFKTHWIGAQSIRGRCDSDYGYQAIKSKEKIYRDSVIHIDNDFQIFNYLDKLLYRNGKNFYIIHQIGSHSPYFYRFDKDHAKYSPYCEDSDLSMLKCNQLEIENAYRNSVLYTDTFLTEVLKRFKDKKAIIFYTSDHGQNTVHINQDENALIIPAFIYFNNLPELEKKLTKLPISNFNHDKVLDTVLGCAGVKSDLINQENNICGKKYKKN